jgi:hypothetical protein
MNYEKCGMNDVKIVNEELKGILNGISDIIQSVDIDLIRQIPRDENAEDWCSEDYRKYIVSKGREHEGYPEMLLGAGLQFGEFEYEGDGKLPIITGMEKCVTELCTWSGAHRRALSALYPPGGFISWHNNANAGGYNVLFTWSQNGDGQWEHIQPNTGEHIVIPDVKGWQCKFGYYGRYDEPNFLLYHCARTNCLRATVAFVFNADERGKSMAEMLIEDIQNA